MDEEHLQPDSEFLANESGKNRVDNGGDDRISELPNEILFVILSLLPVRIAASTAVLSSRWLDLWKQNPNLKFNLESDRISQLPDQVISIILSFLPLKRAAATCVLSSRWSDSWKYTPILNFDNHVVPISGPENSREDVRKYMAMVNSILQLHRSLSLKEFIICFYVDKSAKRAVTKWLEFVFLRKVESLTFDFNCWTDHDKVVLGESLREISTIYGNPQTLIFFESLKSLELDHLELSSEDIELFLRNCPLLEILIIRAMNLTSDLEVCGPSLKHLEITDHTSEFRCVKSIKVSAPNLTYIRFNDEVGKLLFDNVPILVNAYFETYTSEFVMHHFASAASFHISQLQSLDIILYDSQLFWSSAFPQMPNLKKLVIDCYGMCRHSLLPVTRLIWGSPRLEEFTLKFSGMDDELTPYMHEITNVGRSPHQHLKVFGLTFLNHRHDVSDHVVELVTYISNNCIGLRRVHIGGSVERQLLQSLLPNHVQLSLRLL